MPTNVIMPALGVAQQTGTLLKWLKAEGQSVAKGEPLMEIETDKATVEVEAAAAGVLTQVIAKAGDEVPVGQTIALIVAPGESPPEKIAPSALPSTATQAKAPQPTIKPVAQPGPVESRTERLLASPAAKRIAREEAIDLTTVKGSGPERSIVAQDVLQAAKQRSPSSIAAPAVQEIAPLSSMRRIAGERMTQSKQSAPHFYISMDIDMTSVSKLRTAWKERGGDGAPSINDFILHACARALKDFPSLNSTFTEQGIKLHKDINIGVAVALDEGLVVPVIHNTDRLSLGELAVQGRALIDKAQKKKLFPLDYESGTFTVSNLGMLGVDSFIAIINPPQCAILAVGRVTPRVVAEDDMFSIKSCMTATLSADHRIVDGAIAARFLRQVKELLETPKV